MTSLFSVLTVMISNKLKIDFQDDGGFMICFTDFIGIMGRTLDGLSEEVKKVKEGYQKKCSCMQGKSKKYS
jgi:hypothetical protein